MFKAAYFIGVLAGVDTEPEKTRALTMVTSKTEPVRMLLYYSFEVSAASWPL
jgi:hypothetical protein